MTGFDRAEPIESPELNKVPFLAGKAPDTMATPVPAGLFPVVGIGASAGGLEAFESFFAHLPSGSGVAFVLVQHLDPTHKSMLVELLQRHTSLPVFQAEEGMAVEPDCIYAIPPNYDLSLRQGVLHLVEPARPRGRRFTIDFFFQSLARDRRELAIGIILSGAGTDGALGLAEIKSEGGLVVVQEPVSALHEGMPRSAIATGLADYILPPDKMPEQLLRYVQQLSGLEPQIEAVFPAEEHDPLNEIFLLLRRYSGQDFSLYKRDVIQRRIKRRMLMVQASHIDHYIRYLQEDPSELDLLLKEILIGVTSFFRDPEAFAALERQVIELLLREQPAEQPLRIWVPGCSTGEEVYSIAILLREQLDRLQRNLKIHIFATDIMAQAIDKARAGVYPEAIAAQISPERLARFFSRTQAGYQVKPHLREMVVFTLQNLFQDPPFSQLDLISCRNVLIYLEPELQRRIIRLFHYALKPGRFLLLGNSESLINYEEFFRPVDRMWKLFRRSDSKIPLQTVLDFPALFPIDKGSERMDITPSSSRANLLREAVKKVLLEEYSPACVVIDENANIIYFYDPTGRYLEPVTGEANFNLLAMARPGLQPALAAALPRIAALKKPLLYKRLLIENRGDSYEVDLVIRPLHQPPLLQNLALVIFSERGLDYPIISPVEGQSGTTGEDGDQPRNLEQELKFTQETLQATVERSGRTHEELLLNNELLHSFNEELQTMNEELEISREELQSVNEELHTLNAELQSKIEGMTQVTADLNNFLASIEVGTIFLSQDLRVIRFTPRVTELVHLIETDIGRSFSDFAFNLVDEDLIETARQVLNTLVPLEKEVQTRSGEWYRLRVRPYRTLENAVDGLVLTFTEITQQKKDQAQLQQTERELRLLLSLIQAIDEAEDFDHALQVTLDHFCKVSNCLFAEVWLPNAEATELGLGEVYYSGDPGNTVLQQFRARSSETGFLPQAGLPGRVWASGQPEWVDDLSDFPREKYARLELAAEAGLKTALGIPIIVEGKILAVMIFYKDEPNTPDERMINLISALARQLGAFLQRKQNITRRAANPG